MTGPHMLREHTEITIGTFSINFYSGHSLLAHAVVDCRAINAIEIAHAAASNKLTHVEVLRSDGLLHNDVTRVLLKKRPINEEGPVHKTIRKLRSFLARGGGWRKQDRDMWVKTINASLIAEGRKAYL